MQEVVFHSIYRTLSIPLTKEVTQIVGNQMIQINAKLAHFENHIFRTSDETEIQTVRSSPAYQRKEIFEVTEADEEALKKPVQEKIRGPITSASITGGEEKETGPRLEEKKSGITKCSVCKKEFDDDFSGARLRMHMISHRKKQPSVEK